MNHTPGPWKVDLDAFETGIAIVSDKDLIVGEAWPFEELPDNEHDEACKANANLISASPDLLHACHMMLEKFEYEVLAGEAGWDAVTAAREAIKKAEGFA